MTPQKNTEISVLFKCDSSTRAFYGLKDGKITVNFQNHREFFRLGAKPGCSQGREAFEVRWGPQGVAGATAVTGPN